MWLARPVYEFLPYLYMLVGVVLLGAAWFIEMSTLPSIAPGARRAEHDGRAWCCGCGGGTTARAQSEYNSRRRWTI